MRLVRKPKVKIIHDGSLLSLAGEDSKGRQNQNNLFCQKYDKNKSKIFHLYNFITVKVKRVQYFQLGTYQ